MRKIFVLGLLLTFLVFPAGISAQLSTDDHTASEEVQGKEIWDKLQAKQLECRNLTDDNFEVLGEYVMGQSIGNTQRHIFMNQRMKNMMGEKGEKQMHIALGKRYIGCDSWSFVPMMWWMMRGGGNPMPALNGVEGMGYGGWNNMMGWGGFGLLGFIPMIIFWALLILGVIALIRYLGGGTPKESKTPLEILKDRYAKGEINKKEFEEMKKDLR